MNNREWLDYDESNGDIMTCKVCTKHSSRQTSTSCANLTNANKFLTGCMKFRISTSAMHRNAIAIETAKSALASASDIRATDAGKALMSLKTAEKARMMYLMRNAHAVINHNRPISDYTACWTEQKNWILVKRT